MEYKVAELEGAMLDEAVAKALGYPSGHQVPESLCGTSATDGGVEPWMPSTWWEQGGPVTERERIATVFDGAQWMAWPDAFIECGGSVESHAGVYAVGPTPLIAAMRAYVASKFGKTIDLP